MSSSSASFNVDCEAVFKTLASTGNPSPVRVREILAKALELKGLDSEEVAALCQVTDPVLRDELFDTARRVKEGIYGRRLVLFAPLYISNLCGNECLYCAFRASNREVRRRALSQEEIRHETEMLVDQGHKRVLLVSGESYPNEGFDYVLKSVETVYSVKRGNGEIRRINVNVAPLELDQFHALKATGIGTYQLFQETYHPETYAHMHTGGKKKNFVWRLSAMDRAMEAGIDDVGVGVLFGLYDWRFEVLALMQHIRHLEAQFGVGPHTISVPRIEPACGSPLADAPPYEVSDDDFKKLVAILRLAVPYTGLILSTRENPETRRESFSLGVSQISAGSRTNPGGYAETEQEDMAQFSLGDHRSLDEVIRDIVQERFIPSFCTACYRLGRTGEDFMDLAKPGLIKDHCDVNAISTFMEYLLDYASAETRAVSIPFIESSLERMETRRRNTALRMLEKVKAGERDVLV